MAHVLSKISIKKKKIFQMRTFSEEITRDIRMLSQVRMTDQRSRRSHIQERKRTGRFSFEIQLVPSLSLNLSHNLSGTKINTHSGSKRSSTVMWEHKQIRRQFKAQKLSSGFVMKKKNILKPKLVYYLMLNQYLSVKIPSLYLILYAMKVLSRKSQTNTLSST